MDKFTCTRFLIFIFVNSLFSVVLGLRCSTRPLPGCREWGLLRAAASLSCWGRRLRHAGFGGLPHPGPGAPALTQTPSAQASGLVPGGLRTSGPRAQSPHSMGNLLGLEMEPCPLHGEANSYPPHCRGSPVTGILKL